LFAESPTEPGLERIIDLPEQVIEWGMKARGVCLGPLRRTKTGRILRSVRKKRRRYTP
jgi:hypothetical protein